MKITEKNAGKIAFIAMRQGMLGLFFGGFLIFIGLIYNSNFALYVGMIPMSIGSLGFLIMALVWKKVPKE